MRGAGAARPSGTSPDRPPGGSGGREFGRVQDVEWAFDADGVLWLLQSRPVTAVGSRRAGDGPLLGPGPVGETFPEPLRALEEDLWLDPLRSGITSAITLVGRLAPADRGRVAPGDHRVGPGGLRPRPVRGLAVPASGWRWLDPRVPARRLASAWRVGRLRAVLAELAGEVCRRVDGELAGLGPLGDLSDAELLEVLCRVRAHLAAVHGHEILAGTLLDREAATTGAGVAMSVVRRGRALGLADDEIVARWPVALALTAPRIGAPACLPPTVEAAPGEPGPAAATSSLVAGLPPREALRLRARWLQELSARVADVLARRLSTKPADPLAGVPGPPAPGRARGRGLRLAGPAGPRAARPRARTAPALVLPLTPTVGPSGCSGPAPIARAGAVPRRAAPRDVSSTTRQQPQPGRRAGDAHPRPAPGRVAARAGGRGLRDRAAC